MSHWWSPFTLARLELLKQLQKRAAALQAANLPVPASLSTKIAELEAKVSR